MRLATGVPSGVMCVVARELEKPSAPARIASATAASIARRSSSLAGSSSARRPIAYIRKAECPIYMPQRRVAIAGFFVNGYYGSKLLISRSFLYLWPLYASRYKGGGGVKNAPYLAYAA